MRPTNVLACDEFLVKQLHNTEKDEDEEVKPTKPGYANQRIFKTEKKNATLSAIIKHEHSHFINNEPADGEPKLENESQKQEISLYDKMDASLRSNIQVSIRICSFSGHPNPSNIL